MTIDQPGLTAELLAFVRGRGSLLENVTPETDLLESGLLDSLLLMDLIFHIEEKYGIRFDGDQVTPFNFCKISNVVESVHAQMKNS